VALRSALTAAAKKREAKELTRRAVAAHRAASMLAKAFWILAGIALIIIAMGSCGALLNISGSRP